MSRPARKDIPASLASHGIQTGASPDLVTLQPSSKRQAVLAVARGVCRTDKSIKGGFGFLQLTKTSLTAEPTRAATTAAAKAPFAKEYCDPLGDSQQLLPAGGKAEDAGDSDTTSVSDPDSSAHATASCEPDSDNDNDGNDNHNASNDDASSGSWTPEASGEDSSDCSWMHEKRPGSRTGSLQQKRTRTLDGAAQVRPGQ